MRLNRKLFYLLSTLLFATPLIASSTWYVRSDGGSRYSANAKNGQCDGKGDLAYPGSGTNRHCAFNDYRYLWDDRASYGVTKWVINGGDTVILRRHFVNGVDVGWRVGFDQGMSANDPWCSGGNGTFSCSNPMIPAGTPALHTRILGEHYEHCTNDSDKTEVFGGFGVYAALNLSGAQYVDVQCLNLTRHSQCITHGDPRLPSDCSRSLPISDYDSDGITTDTGTHDLLLQDMWIHGHTDRGIIGAIGGLVVANRVVIGYNGMGGWDFDDGHSTPSLNATLRFNHSVIEWNGCNQEYPAKHSLPAISCYSQSSGGYGDGMGTPAGMGMDVYIDHSIFRYNTQDGEDFGHVDAGSHTIQITNSFSYGNGGAQFKWGGNFTSAVFTNNVALGNCARMSTPIAGTPEGYNAHLGDFCRAGDAVSFNFRQGGTALMAGNTIVSYSPVTMDISCWDPSCSNSVLTFKNNIVRGYDNPHTYSFGGQPGGPGSFYFGQPIGKVIRANNIYFGLRGAHCLTSEICADPKFSNEPGFSKEQDLDDFNFHLTGKSPARNAGVRIPDMTTDFDDRSRPASGNYSIGALE